MSEHDAGPEAGEGHFGTRDRKRQVRLTPAVCVAAGTIAIGALTLGLYLYGLGHNVHTDTILWFDRTDEFWSAIDDGRWSDTYISPHPGVAWMWISGVARKAFGVFEQGMSAPALGPAAAPSVLAGVLGAALTVPLLWRFLGAGGIPLAFLAALMIATEPTLVRASRRIHLDMLASASAWIGVLCTLVAAKLVSSRWAVAAGISFGIAATTRLSMGPVLIGAALVASAFWAFGNIRAYKRLGIVVAIAGTSLAISLLLWPALLTDPIDTIQRAIGRSLAMAGAAHKAPGGRIDPGPQYYFIQALRIAPPETILVAAAGLFLGILDARRRQLVLAVLFSYLPLIIATLLADKKLSRYSIPAYPVLAFLAAVGIEIVTRRLLARFAGRRPHRVMALAMFFVVTSVTAARAWRIGSTLPKAPVCFDWAIGDCDTRFVLKQELREVALFMKSRSKRERPRVLIRNGLENRLWPWLYIRRVSRLQQADYLVFINQDYVGNGLLSKGPRLRRWRGAEHFVDLSSPAYEIKTEKVVAIRVYYGPLHAKYQGKRATK